MIDGPRLAPASGNTRKLVVFLHGYGADGNDLIAIGREWSAVLPDTAFVSPNAPEPCGGAPFGRQWFPLTFRDPGERWRGVEQARPELDAFLDAEQQRYGLASGDIALVGFSQGTMMALHVGLRRAPPIAGIIGYSGVLVTPPGMAVTDMTLAAERPPVLLIHGDQDEVIPPQALGYSSNWLKELGVETSTHLSPGIGHGIDGVGLQLGAAFLARTLGLVA